MATALERVRSNFVVQLAEPFGADMAAFIACCTIADRRDRYCAVGPLADGASRSPRR
jgi:hypothetical protein